MTEKLGILLTTTPESENTYTCMRLAEAALATAKEVDIFLMCDGVYNIYQKEFTALQGKGVKIFLCDFNAQARAIEEREDIVFGSQYDLACIVHECDKFISLN
jgi:sulfur relay (sulfurtransferase) complex TusBCD TusD component (DsrE family)